MVFKNISCLIFAIFVTVFSFTEVFCHNLKKRQEQEKQNCGPLEQISNGKIISLSKEYTIGSPVPNYAIIKIVCNENYSPSTQNNLIVCLDGVWSTPIPKCVLICPPRISSTVEVKCIKDGLNIDCTKPLVNGTVAVSNCIPLYIQAYDIATVSICQNGSWDTPLPKCVPECGIPIPKGVTNIMEDLSSRQGPFPWHINVYRFKNDKYNYQCGGSIITPLVIISSAHCFTDEYGKKNPPSDYWIAAGKYYIDYNAVEDVLAQKIQVQNVHIPPIYRGFGTNFAGDIAVVIIKRPFQMTNVVQPVCIDWQNQYENQQLKPENIGEIESWGCVDPSNQTSAGSATLKKLNVPYIDLDQCLEVVPPQFRRWVTPDKFCAGHSNGPSIYRVDIGGGMVFPWKENNKEKFYLRGLVSVGVINKTVCVNFQHVLYTKISAYKDFIINIVAQNKV